ncbi:DUF302 domain-containing protein [Sulfobacillus thermosulfidooxidans]|uniref:DUF302 domain-containing protein n=1 Tax=Sulfobacillus thermosulfidooxidans TaxID=28034 RepID=UPI0006B50F54|nr:DUF302 domain-containing protein [Sulfobacillus thermosulfidooxidans]
MSAIEQIEVSRPAAELVNQFTHWLEEKQIIVYAVVHHTEDMKARGVDPHMDAWTVIFGNPVLGAAFLEETPDVVVDIPLRIGFYQQQPDKSFVVRRHMEELLSDYQLPALVAKSRKADGLLDQWIATLKQSSQN